MSTVNDKSKTFANSLYIAYDSFGRQTQHRRKVISNDQMEFIIPISIYILIPIIGSVLFYYTNKNFKPDEKEELYTLKLLIAFGNIGGLTILLLTTLFWKWSGLATIGTAFLILIGPILMAMISYDSYKKRKNEAEYKLFKMSISYFIFLPLILLIAIILEK